MQNFHFTSINPSQCADLGAWRLDLDKERQGRVAAEQQAAVLAAKLEAANKRTGKADAAMIESLA